MGADGIHAVKVRAFRKANHFPKNHGEIVVSGSKNLTGAS